MQDGVRFLRTFFERFDRFGCGKNLQCNLAPFRFTFYFLHYRQRTVGSGSDDQMPALPRWPTGSERAKFYGSVLCAILTPGISGANE